MEKNSDGDINVIRKPYCYASIIDTCFDHLRLYAKENIFVTLEILTAISEALLQANHKELQTALRNKAATIVNQIHIEKIPKEETHKADVFYRKIMAMYESCNERNHS